MGYAGPSAAPGSEAALVAAAAAAVAVVAVDDAASGAGQEAVHALAA